MCLQQLDVIAVVISVQCINFEKPGVWVQLLVAAAPGTIVTADKRSLTLRLEASSRIRLVNLG